MAQRKQKQTAHWVHDFRIMSVTLILAITLTTVLFRYFNLGFVQTSPVQNVHSAASETLVSENVFGGNVEFSVNPSQNGYSFVGGTEIELMKFHVSADTNSELNTLTFTLDSLANPYDLKSVQLYQNDNLIADISVFEGKAIFNNLRIQVTKNLLESFELKGELSDQANAGDRVRLLFKSAAAVSIKDLSGKDLKINGLFPLAGNVISVIGKQRS